MNAAQPSSPRFEAERDIAGLPEPVRRYFVHALADGAQLPQTLDLAMEGRINPGVPLAFAARQRFSGHAFEWRARAGIGRLRPLRVVDSFDGHGRGSTSGWLFGRLRFLHADDADTGRAAAGRSAAESVWTPWRLLPREGVEWRADADNLIVATFAVEPETVDLTLRLAPDGAVRSVSLQRWGNVGRDGFGYIPFGGDVLREARFGDWIIPTRLAVGWWYGTPRFKPFFDATVTAATG